MRGFIGRQEVKNANDKVVVEASGMLGPVGRYFTAAKTRVSGPIEIPKSTKDH
jgi:hypothetical protein